jgi:DNA polymerase bacteriophage-type
MIAVDFETFSALDLSKVGAQRYAAHASTGIICAVFVDTLTDERVTWRPGQGVPRWCRDPSRNYVAHNAGFDRAIWEHHFPAPTPPLKQWECSAVRCSINGYPRSLDDASIAILGKPAKDPAEKKALEIMMRVKDGKRIDTPELRALVESRCMTDTLIMLELYDKCTPPTEAQMAWWYFDQEVNERGIPVNTADIERMLQVLGAEDVGGAYEHARHRLGAATGYAVTKPSQVARLKAWLLDSEGLHMDSLAKDAVEEVLTTQPDITPAARAALEIKRAIGGTAPKKFAAFAARAEPDPDHQGRGWIRDGYVCNGAHTGRDTAQGPQMQNLKRVTAKPDELALMLSARDNTTLDLMIDVGIEPLELAGMCVRPMVQAMPGHKLLVGDFAKIETCGLFWLAGEARGLRLLREGADLYCDLATAIRGRPVTKDMAEDRQLGKTGILGLGFGCGEERFREMCRVQYGLIISEADALKAKTVYRSTYAAVPRFWYALEGAVRECIMHKTSRQVDKLRVQATPGLLTIKLPSGRELRYRNPRVGRDDGITFDGPRSDDEGASRGYGKVSTYGGKLCLAADTKVLTKLGWKYIANVSNRDTVWDGHAWVSCDGAIYNGVRATVEVDGVRATPDHKVLTNAKGWRTFSEISGLKGADFWPMDCRVPGGIEKGETFLVRAMCLWSGNNSPFIRPETRGWLQTVHGEGSTSDAWNVATPGLRSMAIHAGSMSTALASSMAQLRSARHFSMRGMAGKFSSFLARYGIFLRARVDTGSREQQRQLLQSELSLDYGCGAKPQPEGQRAPRDDWGHHDGSRSERPIRYQTDNALLSDDARMAYGTDVRNGGHEESVWDVMNCGPRNQFLVKCDSGYMIVHNCENVVQAVACDLLREAALTLTSLGYSIVMRSHDELVSHEEEQFADPETYASIMSLDGRSGWWDGLPISVEAKALDRYTK